MTDGLIIAFLGLLVALIAIVTPIIKLNSNITELNCNFKSFREALKRNEHETENTKETVARHELDINNAKKDIKILYRKAEDLEHRKE